MQLALAFTRPSIVRSVALAISVGVAFIAVGSSVSAAPILTTLDSVGSVGTYTSIAVGADGLPVLSYYDVTNGDLKVMHCGDAACSAGNTATTVDSTGNIGSHTSLAIGADGLPVISYYDVTNGDLKVTHCGNAACSSGNTTTTVDSTGNVGLHTSLAIGADSLPVISFRRTLTDGNLKVVHCGNASCSSGNTVTTVESMGGAGQPTSVVIGTDDLPVISYYDDNLAVLKVTHCGNASCSAGNTITTVDSSGDAGLTSSVAIGADGLPVISYYDAASGDLKVMHCGDAACSAGNTATTVDSTGDVGVYSSLAIGADGYPVVSYHDGTNGDLKGAACDNAYCDLSGSPLAAPFFSGPSLAVVVILSLWFLHRDRSLFPLSDASPSRAA